MVTDPLKLESRVARSRRPHDARNRVAELILRRWPRSLRDAYHSSMRQCFSAMAGGNPDAARDAFIAAAIKAASGDAR